ASIGFRLLELAFPAAGAQQLRANLINRHPKDRAQQFVSALADRFLWRPPVQLLSAPIPVGDDVAHITDKNRVMCEVEQAGLLGSFRHFDLKFIAGFPKLLLDPSSPGAEPGDHECE